jgi:hypothetical protein
MRTQLISSDADFCTPQGGLESQHALNSRMVYQICGGNATWWRLHKDDHRGFRITVGFSYFDP